MIPKDKNNYTIVVAERMSESGFWIKEYNFYPGHLWGIFISGENITDERFKPVYGKRSKIEYIGYTWDLNFPIQYPIECHTGRLLYKMGDKEPPKKETKIYGDYDDFLPEKIKKKAVKKRIKIISKPVSESVRTIVFRRDKYTCVICGTTAGISMDHIIPVSRGGLTTIDNCQCMCRSCNGSKGNLLISNEMLKELLGYKK